MDNRYLFPYWKTSEKLVLAKRSYYKHKFFKSVTTLPAKLWTSAILYNILTEKHILLEFFAPFRINYPLIIIFLLKVLVESSNLLFMDSLSSQKEVTKTKTTINKMTKLLF